jgi:riboflavin kinase/FMN adenylyltransferase
LQAGDMAEAARLLTRPFAIQAPVIHGDKRGRTIGVPTANQELGPYVRPRYGVYAVRVRLPDGSSADGVANLGVRPMFTPPKELLETWILDWSGDLYGQSIEVELVSWLRPEMALDGLEALKAQIARDADAARRVLSA